MISIVAEVVRHAAYLSRGVSFNSLNAAEAGTLPPVGSQVRCNKYYGKLSGEKVLDAFMANRANVNHLTTRERAHPVEVKSKRERLIDRLGGTFQISCRYLL